MQKQIWFCLKCAILMILIGLLNSSVQGKYSGNFPEAISKAFGLGETSEIVKYFEANIDVEILGSDNNGSKSRAEKMLKTFFSKHPVTKFSVIFEGGRDVSQYSVGKLVTLKGTFRVNILLKEQHILQLRIDEDGN